MKTLVLIVGLLVMVLAAPAVAQTESNEGTTVTTVGPIINASRTRGTASPSGPFDTFALNGTGGILRNGVFDSVTANVISLVYHNHTTYQNTSTSGWFIDTGVVNGWVATSAPVISSLSNLIPDLSNAAAHPVTGFPANKIAYSVHLFPINVAGSYPDTPLATVTPIWNSYFGSLVKNGTAPVLNLATGCSCDGSNGNLADDQAFMGNWVAYANGLASGGPAFTGAQQPMGNAWYSWSIFSSENPNGNLNSNGSLKGTVAGQAGGQAFYWSQLLYTAAAPVVPPQTTWNGLDKSAGITLSNSNLTASTTVASSQSVRATTSQSSGQRCFAVTADTITAGWAVGLANSGYNLTAAGGLGTDTNGIGFLPNKVSALQGIFYGNVNLSSGAATSANGESTMICVDFGTSRFWATDSAMRTALGSGVWNNTAGCDPTNAGCAKSFSGLTCPCFPAYNNLQTGGVATLGTTVATMPFTVPAGFTTWDLPVTGGHPIVMIFGANDNQPRPANDDRPELAFLERWSR